MKMRRLVAHVPSEDYDTFRVNHPAYGAWTWFVRECLQRFNELHMETPGELIQTVVEGIEEDME